MKNSLHTNRGQGRTVLRVPGTLLVLLAALGSIRDAAGAPVVARHAAAAVQGWLATERAPLSATLGQQVKRTETFNDAAGVALYHVVYLDPAGFVIVAADDLIEPILGFAPSGTYDPSRDNPLGALVSRDLPGRLARVKGLAAADARGALLAAKSKWEKLQSSAPRAIVPMTQVLNVSDVRVEPLTQTMWSQSTVGGDNACYNYYTPDNAAGSASNYVCGCTATAMAQILRFWQYPVSGVGTASYNITVTDVARTRNLRGGNGAGGPYDWANMANSPSSLVQRQAVGALCADAGVAVHMAYNTGNSGASGAYIEDANTAFVSTFKYTNAVYSYGTAKGVALNGILNTNLDAGCPVLLGIYSPSVGHAVVCDGYGYTSSTLYHHLNLGWGGSQTAWYTLPTIDTSGLLFDSVDICCYNIWTIGTGEIISGRITDTDGTPIAGVAMTATRASGGAYTATTNARGIYALAKIPSSSQYSVSASKTGYRFAAQSVSTGQSSGNTSSTGNRWSVDFSPTDNLTQFAAIPASTSQIDLSWVKNAFNNDVLVAWNTTNTFGTPSGSYAAGDIIAGGGSVLYNGGTTSVSHPGRTAGTTYYYKAWSVLAGPSYSSGAAASATTGRGVPFAETFENGGAIPIGWTQEFVTGSVSWTFRKGGYNNGPTAAHSGYYNACLYMGSTADHTTKLVTPRIELGANLLGTRLTFWHCMQVYNSNQDQLKVYYKTSAGATWTLVATYLANVAQWTQQSIALPDSSGSCWIAFEGNAKNGYGVCIDDVQVTTAPSIATASPLPAVAVAVGAFYYQTLAASGGKTAYSWFIASGSLPPNMSLTKQGDLFGTPTAATTAIFTVRVTGFDGLSSTKDFSLTVTDVAFANWAGGAGLTGDDALPEAQPFGDGIKNILKYSFNMNGSGPDVGILVPGTGTSGLPVVTRDVSGPTPVFRFEYLRRKVSGLDYSPVQSSSLTAGTWQPMTGTLTVSNIDDTWERVVIEHPYVASAPSQFLKLVVTQF